MVHRLNQHSLSPLDAWCISLCSQAHIFQCLWFIGTYVSFVITCMYSRRVQFFVSKFIMFSDVVAFFAFLVPRWLDSTGSSGISMISDSLGFGLGVCVCVCVFARACAYRNLITLSLKCWWYHSLLCQRRECHQCKQ